MDTLLRNIQRRLRGLLRPPVLSTPGDSPFGNLDYSAAMWLNRELRDHAVGFGSYGRPRVLSWGEGAKLSVGKYCSFAEGVIVFLGGEHRIDWVTTYPFSAIFPDIGRQFPGHPHTKGNVTIGNDVWIGFEAVILSGVTIGDGAVVGARAVVGKNIEPYSIVAGNPSRKVRDRFPQGVVDELRRICWWDWPEEEIMASMQELLDPDPRRLIQSYDDRMSPPENVLKYPTS